MSPDGSASFVPDPVEVAWAAGFFDGEGTTCITRYQPKNQSSPAAVLTLGVTQADPEPLERFRRAVGGFGVVNGPYLYKNGNQKKPQWRYRVSGLARVEYVYGLIAPHLCSPKREQATAAIAAMRAQQVRPGRPTVEYCKRGHDLGVVGRKLRNGDRRCHRCEQLRSLAAYYRRKGDHAEADRVLNETHVSRKSWRTDAVGGVVI